VNQFRERAEYIPLYFSASAPLILALALVLWSRWPAVWKDLGYLVGWAAILIGLAGVLFHLESHFFYERTLRSLTYSAPFAAPLAYTGLGFLLVVNRMVDPASKEVPVVASAVAVGFLGVPLLLRVERPFIDLCLVVLLAEAAVGIWGFALHALGNLRGPSIQAFDNFIYGAPPLAPLLFPNLVILGIIALWGLRAVTAS
jgi:hypothetical protein